MGNPETDLTELDGVGPSTADNLREAGLETVDDVGTADLDVLADVFSDVPGIAEDQVEDVKADAAKLAFGTPDDDDEQAEAAEADEGPEMHTVTVEATTTVWPHAVSAILDEATRMRQRNRHDAEADLYRITFELMDGLSNAETETAGDDRLALDFTTSARSLNFVHQALSAGVSNYRAMSGITGLWGDLQLVVDQLDDARADVQ